MWVHYFGTISFGVTQAIFPNAWMLPRIDRGGGGVLPLKGLQGYALVKTPFSCSLRCSTSPFQHFSVPQDPILTTNHNMFPNFPFKCLILANFQFLILKISQNPVQEASNWAKNQF